MLRDSELRQKDFQLLQEFEDELTDIDQINSQEEKEIFYQIDLEGITISDEQILVLVTLPLGTLDNQYLDTNLSNNIFTLDVIEIPDEAPRQLQFDISVEGNTVNLTNAWIYDGDGYDNIQRVDLWIRKDDETWQDIADITNFNPWESNNDWAIINHQIDFSDYESGSYEIWAKGYDENGLESNIITQIFEFSQVNIAPERLQFNVSVDNNTVNLTNAWIYDEDGYQDLSYVDLWVRKDGGTWQDIEDITNFNPWASNNNWAIINHQIDFSDYESGSYELWAKGYDKQGLESNEITQSFEFERVNIAPERLQFNISVDGNVVNLTDAWIYDEDGYDNLQRVDLWVRKDEGTWQDIEDITNFNPWASNNNWAIINHQIDFSDYESGSYEIWAKSYDQQGLESNVVTKTFEFTQGNTPPERLQFQLNQQNYQPTETLILEDAWVYDEDGYSDVANVDFWVYTPAGNWIDVSDANSFSPWANNSDWGSFEYSLNVTELEGSGIGEHTLWGRATDENGAKSNIVTKTFTMDNVAPSPTGLSGYFDLDAQVYTSNDTLHINNGWVRDFNGVADIQRIDFWLKKEGQAWQDIDDILSNEITPWSSDTTWGSFDYDLDLMGLGEGSYTLWSGVQDETLADNGTWANIVQNTFEIQG